MNEILTCTTKCHKNYGSIYAKTEVPIELFKDKNSDKLFKQCIDCRNHGKNRNKIAYDKNKKEKNEKYEEIIKNNEEYIPCLYYHHDNKIYPKNKVPRKLFEIENTDNLTKTCLNCRNHNILQPKIKEIEIDEYYETIDDECEVMTCLSKKHDNTIYPKNKVPVKFFIKYPNIPNSPLTKNCEKCRKKRAEEHEEQRKNSALKAEEKGLFYCISCDSTVKHSERGINIDGTLAANCTSCHDKRSENNKILKQFFIKLKHEYVQKYQSCCYLCNKIYIYNNDILTPIETILEGNIRYIEYNNIIYYVNDFINEYSSIINVDMLHFDHLSETEQRERNIIKPDEPFLNKKDQVSRMSNEIKMRFEASKCQLLCGKCHVIETIRREDEKRIEKHGNINPIKITGSNAIKRDYVDKLKKQGCSVCNHVDTNLLRFFHFDHIDPALKIDNITTMIYGKYSFEQLVTEINKCRIVCLHCHVVHTQTQHDDGVYRIKKKHKPIIRDLLKVAVKVNQYDKNHVFIKQYASMAETTRSCNIPTHTLHKILDNKKEHHLYIFEMA
jgi:hypothetical protein